MLHNVVVFVYDDVVCGHCGSIVGYFNGAVEHALYKGFIVVLCEVVRPLGGFHGDLNVVKFGIVAGYEAEGCDLAAVVSPIAVFDNVLEGCLDGCAETLSLGVSCAKGRIREGVFWVRTEISF
mgnify:CR=1 FL=1